MKEIINIIIEKFKQGIIISYLNQSLSIIYIFIVIYLFNIINGNLYYGQYILLGSILSVVSSFTGLSSGEGVIYFLSKKKYNTIEILKWGFLIDLLFGLILILIISVCVNYISKFVDDISTQLIFLFGLRIVFKNLRNVVVGFWQFGEKFPLIYKINLIENLFLVILLLLTLLGIYEFNLIFLVKSEFLITILFTILTYMIFIRELIKKSFISISNEHLSKKEFVIYNSKLFLSRTIKSGNQKFDNIIVGLFLSTNEVAIYDKIKKIFLPINIFINPLREIFLPKLLNLVKSNKLNFIRSNIFVYTKVILIFSFFFLLFTNVFNKYLFDYLGIVSNLENSVIFYSLCYSTLYITFFWWPRLLSNAFNPNLSIVANIISSLTILTVTPLFLYTYGFIGLGFTVIVNSTILAVFWLSKFNIYVNN